MPQTPAECYNIQGTQYQLTSLTGCEKICLKWWTKEGAASDTRLCERSERLRVGEMNSGWEEIENFVD